MHQQGLSFGATPEGWSVWLTFHVKRRGWWSTMKKRGLFAKVALIGLSSGRTARVAGGLLDQAFGLESCLHARACFHALL